MTSDQTPARPARIDSVDLLRGIVMIIMALDHARDFFHRDAVAFDPTDLTKTNILLFFTRWITHYCAPIFVFLAGTGVFLSLARRKSKSWMSKFLLTRGVWLIVLELTVIRFAWAFNVDYASFTVVQVIWVIGVSMIVLAGLIHLRLSITIAFGALLVLLHNTLDGIQAETFGTWSNLWYVLHVQGLIQIFGINLFVIYPLVPWIGVMALGYSFGSIITLPESERKGALLRLSTVLIGALIILRAINMYGDPYPWSAQHSALFTFLSFLNTTKYPPSLLFLLMTIGPAILSLAYLEKWKGWLADRVVIFGRVPMFYYILHIFVLHIMSGIANYPKFGLQAFTIDPLNLPAGFGFELWIAYAAWIVAIAILYSLCKWYADLKKRSSHSLLSYL
ncbi:MAG: heparan-alpha-glucosaminide N-acetyltransferase domain-containing protein [Bacteroidota bacterium]